MKSEAKQIRPWKEGFHFSIEPKVVFETEQLSEQEMIREFYKGHLACGDYGKFRLLIKDRDIFRQMLYLMKIIIRYDFKNLPIHILRISLKIIKKTIQYG
jgi:hypothetical protein